MLDEVSARLDLRKKQRRRKRAKKLAVLVGLIVTALFCCWVVCFSDLLVAKKIEVTGNQITDTQTIIDTANLPLGQPLATMDFGPATQRLLAIAGISEVKIKRSWPHTIKIVVTERQLVFQRKAGNSYQWVDAEGQIFLTKTESSPGLVVEAASDDKHLLADIAKVVLALPKEVSDQMVGLNASSRDDIVVLLKDDRRIIWGDAQLNEEKATVIVALLKQQAKVYNVSVPSHPAIS